MLNISYREYMYVKYIGNMWNSYIYVFVYDISHPDIFKQKLI